MQVSAAETLAKGLLKEYLPSEFDNGLNWEVKFINSTTFTWAVIHHNLFVISTPLVEQNCKEIVRDAILHEIGEILRIKKEFKLDILEPQVA